MRVIFRSCVEIEFSTFSAAHKWKCCPCIILILCFVYTLLFFSSSMIDSVMKININDVSGGNVKGMREAASIYQNVVFIMILKEIYAVFLVFIFYEHFYNFSLR